MPIRKEEGRMPMARFPAPRARPAGQNCAHDARGVPCWKPLWTG
jgi:hypothetical protein